MDLLISSGADQNSMDKFGKTASQVMKNKGKCCPVTRENQSQMLMISFFSKKKQKIPTSSSQLRKEAMAIGISVIYFP